MFVFAREKSVDVLFEAREWLREVANRLIFDGGGDTCRAIIQLKEQSASGKVFTIHVTFPADQSEWGELAKEPIVSQQLQKYRRQDEHAFAVELLSTVIALPYVWYAKVDEDSLTVAMTHRRHIFKVKRHLVRTLRREYTWWLRPIQQFIKYDRKRYAAT